jgi:hypothetical protein
MFHAFPCQAPDCAFSSPTQLQKSSRWHAFVCIFQALGQVKPTNRYKSCPLGFLVCKCMQHARKFLVAYAVLRATTSFYAKVCVLQDCRRFVHKSQSQDGPDFDIAGETLAWDGFIVPLDSLLASKSSLTTAGQRHQCWPILERTLW